jgi:WXG100 family type VII secretion target
MPNDKSRADYPSLQQIASLFRTESESTDSLNQMLKRHADIMRDGAWVGKAATAFLAEMDGIVMPSMRRLSAALAEASQATKAVHDAMKAAEQDAAAVLNGQNVGEQPGGSPGASGPGGGANQPGGASGPGNGTGGAGSGEAGTPLLSWERFSGTGDAFEQDWGKSGSPAPKLGFKYKLIEGALADGKATGETTVGGVTVSGTAKYDAVAGEAGLAAGIGDKGFSFGAYGEYKTLSGEAVGVVGGKDLGVTGQVGAKALAAEAQIGIIDNQFGAKIGGTLISAEGQVGVNVAGVNVGVKGEIGLKAELGFEFGAKGVEVKLPFISLGIAFGGAK